MKRLALLLSLLVILCVTTACGGGAPASAAPGSMLGIKDMSPVQPTDDPNVEDGLDYIIEQNATAAAGTATAEANAAAATAAAALFPPATPTLAPARAFVHNVSDGEYVIAIANKYGPNCSIEGIKTLNNLDEKYTISIGQTLTLPDGCMLPASTPVATPAPVTQ